MNDFVNYINSMNNASSDTVEALAESQVLSDYYDKIRIDRAIGKYIADRIKKKERLTIVLTGHAGDGKTSILVQVLRELGLLTPNTPLKEEKEFIKNDIRLYAVKDMSELSENKQIDFCQKALEAPKNNMSAVIISNTGPLLKCLETINSRKNGEKINEAEKNRFQSELLEQLDSNKNEPILIGEYKILLINIARIDNVYFAEKILKKLIADELWSPCENCRKKQNCYIFNNVRLINKYYGRISSFITAFYSYLYENDMRMTIRQMLSQISFSITGNHSCAEISDNSKDVVKFRNLFSNLFFGFSGYDEIDNADQIQGIAYAKSLKLDSKALKCDYKLFVTGDLKDFPSDIRTLVESQKNIFNIKHLNIESNEEKDTVFNDKDTEYRKAIRRTYIFFGQKSGKADKYNILYDELFGSGFNDFMCIQHNEAEHSLIRRMENTITNALYLEMTGISSSQAKEIPITIKRNDDSFQKVMLTNGSLKKSDFKIVAVNDSNEFEDIQNKKKVFLKICNQDTFRITLPMVIYFKEIADGVISTIADPSLTHGISKLKTLLQKNCPDNDEITIIVNNTDVPTDLKLYIYDGKIFVE